MRIRELREAANLQQKQVAAHMGVLQTAVSNWETEVALPKARELPRLAKVLGCSIDDLFVPLEEVG
ncbi:MAG: helix-turn-helix transcriptional regulator [Clostridiales bacterium]|nr:helix-turn-helix transcriptional regulator [Clostridiales bacterium]